MAYVMRIFEFDFIKMGTFIALLLLVPLTGAVPFKPGHQKLRNYKPDLNYQHPTFYSKSVSPNRNAPMIKSIPRRNFKRIWHRKKPFFYIRGQNNQRLPLNSQIPHFKRINSDFSFNKKVRGGRYLKNNLINYYNPNQYKNRIAPLRRRNNIFTSILKNMKPSTSIAVNSYKQNTYVNIKAPLRNQRHKKKLFGFNDVRIVSNQPRGTKHLSRNKSKVRKSWVHKKAPKRINVKKKFGDPNLIPKGGRDGWISVKRNKKFRGWNKRIGKTKRRLFRKNHRHTRDVNIEENANARQIFYNLDEGSIHRKRSLARSGMCDSVGRPINIDLQDLFLPCGKLLQQNWINDFEKKLSLPNYQINCKDNSFTYPKENYVDTSVDYNNINKGETGSSVGFNSGTYDGYGYENVQDRNPEDLSLPPNNNDKGNFYASQEKGPAVPDSETKYNGNPIPATNFAMNEKVQEPENVQINNNERIGCDQQPDLKSPVSWKDEADQDNANKYKRGIDELESELRKYFETLTENDPDFKSSFNNYDKNDNDNSKIIRSLQTTDENKKELDYEMGDFQKPKSKHKHDRKDKDKPILYYVQPKAEDSFTSEPSNEEGLLEENDFSTESSDYKQHQNHKKTKVSRAKASEDDKKKPSKHHYTRYEEVHRAKEGGYRSSDNQVEESDTLDSDKIPGAEFFESFRQSKGIKKAIIPESEENEIASASYIPPIAGSYMNNFVPQNMNRPNQNENSVKQAARKETNSHKNSNLTEVSLDNGRLRSSSLQNGGNMPTAEDSSNLHRTRHDYQPDTVYGHYLSSGKKQENIQLHRMPVPQAVFNNINTKNINGRRVIRRNIENVIKDYNENSKPIVTSAVFTHGRTRNNSDRNGLTENSSRNNRQSGSTITDKKYPGNKMDNSNEKTSFRDEKFLMDKTAFIHNVSPEAIKNYNGDTVRSSIGQASVTSQRAENNRHDIDAIVSNSQTTGEINEAPTTTFKIYRKRSTAFQEKTNRSIYEDSYPKKTNERSDKQNKEVSLSDYNADGGNDLMRNVTNSRDYKNKSSTERHPFNERLNVTKRRLPNALKPIKHVKDTTDRNDINVTFTVFSEVPILEDNDLVRHGSFGSKDKLNDSRESDFDSKQNLDQENNLNSQEPESVPNYVNQILLISSEDKIDKNKRSSGKYTDDTGNKKEQEKLLSGVQLDPNPIQSNESITSRIASNISESLDHNPKDNNLILKRAENIDSTSNSSIYTKKRSKKDASWPLETVKNFTLDEDVAVEPVKTSEPDDSDLSRDNASEANLKRFYRENRKLSTNDTNCTDASEGCEKTIPTTPLGTYSSAEKMKRRSESERIIDENNVIKINVKREKSLDEEEEEKEEEEEDEECTGEECFSNLNMRFHATWSKIFCGGWIEITSVFGNGTMNQVAEKSGKYSKGSFVFNTKVVRSNRSYGINSQDCNIPCSGLPQKLVIRGDKLTRQAVSKRWSDVINYMSGDSVDIWEPFTMEVLSPGSLCQKRNTSFKILLDGTDDDLSIMKMMFVEPEKREIPVNIKPEETESKNVEKEGEKEKELFDNKFKITSNLKIALHKPHPEHKNTMKIIFNSILERTKKSLKKEPGLYSYASGRRCPGFKPLTNSTGKYMLYNPHDLHLEQEANDTFPELNAKLHFFKMTGDFLCVLGNACEKGGKTETLECAFLDMDMMNAVNAKEHFKNVI